MNIIVAHCQYINLDAKESAVAKASIFIFDRAIYPGIFNVSIVLKYRIPMAVALYRQISQMPYI